ncbi:CU044_5270 family protein [Actinomadura geliboluensis]|uniref:CU044_5270 family protein n=1 Tax=Actinomadura geliboluensis TaxID=882440 RepID=A0A5S4G1R0_9ACTN|nr:CU044_5270 family protein [Actinomadura geliboluensis]TMR26947.1 hypothetical protein ETD96_40285 [Actinomadura geliboluensis]
MNELRHVQLLRSEVPRTLDMAAAENRLRTELAEAQNAVGSKTGWDRTGPRRGRARQIRWTLVPAGFGATVLAAALVTGPWTGESSAEAEALMARAARTALHTPVSLPRGDQYVYQQSVEKLRPGGRPYLRYRSEWLSVDGSKPGLIREKNVVAAGTTAPAAEQMRPDGEQVLRACGPAPLLERPYIDVLPSKTAEVLALLDERAGDGSRGERLWNAAADVTAAVMAPAARAAFYRALAEIPDVGVAEDAVDASGRPGVALTRTSDGIQEQLLFDRSTYAFLGERTLDREGSEISSTAVIKTSVVDDAPTPRTGGVQGSC